MTSAEVNLLNVNACFEEGQNLTAVVLKKIYYKTRPKLKYRLACGEIGDPHRQEQDIMKKYFSLEELMKNLMSYLEPQPKRRLRKGN